MYLALDAQTEENGCMSIIPKSNRLGIGNERRSSAAFLDTSKVEQVSGSA